MVCARANKANRRLEHETTMQRQSELVVRGGVSAINRAPNSHVQEDFDERNDDQSRSQKFLHGISDDSLVFG